MTYLQIFEVKRRWIERDPQFLSVDRVGRLKGGNVLVLGRPEVLIGLDRLGRSWEKSRFEVDEERVVGQRVKEELLYV